MVPYEPDWVKAVYHLYVIRSQDRDGLIRHLGDANIGTQIHYPMPLHLQNAYTVIGYGKGDFPVAEKAAAEILSLPMYPGLGCDQQTRIAQSVLTFALPKSVHTLATAAGAGVRETVGTLTAS
jgi:dTDP-4-amino-4,6-dideoxygalactose transaminase